MTDFSTMRTICFTGPRPNKLYGYKNKEKYQKLVDCIHDFLRGFCRIESDEILTVITGGAQGIDQLAFWAANSLKKKYSLKNEVYIPFVGQEELWNETGLFGKKEYRKMKSMSDQKITSTWDKNKYDETLEESIKNFEFGIFCSMEITICYELTPEYNEEKHSEKTKRTEVIHLEIIKNYPLKEKEIVNLMMNPDYEFECNISEEMFSEGVILPGAAYIWFEDIGVEFEFCIENGENYSAIYRMDMNKAGDDFETDHDEFYHYEIDPTDPEWKANLEIEMCRVLILLHDLK